MPTVWCKIHAVTAVLKVMSNYYPHLTRSNTMIYNSAYAKFQQNAQIEKHQGVNSLMSVLKINSSSLLNDLIIHIHESLGLRIQEYRTCVGIKVTS